MSVTATAAPPPLLTAADRCDRCGAQAQVSAIFPGALAELLFCGHHATKHAAALAVQGAVLVPARP